MDDSATQIYFCRSCKLPLVINDSLKKLSNAQQNLLTLNYTERPQSNIIRTNSGLEINTTDLTVSSEFQDDSNIHNQYPVIPPNRKKVFNEAIRSNNKNSSISSTGNIHMSKQKSEDGQTDTNTSTVDTSFVYLHDKAHTDDEIYGHNHLFDSNLSRRDNRIVKSGDPKDDIDSQSYISERIESLDKIFNIISSKYEIDYPVCSDCAVTLISEMKNKYESLNKEKDTYMHFLKKLTLQNGPTLEKTKKLLKDLDSLNDKEQEMLKELNNEELKHSELNKELLDLEEELKQLEVEEQGILLKQNVHDLALQENLEELGRVKHKYYTNLNLLDSLRNTDVFDSFFNISNDGKFGTINKLRLGSLPNVKVTWHEINAALGQLVLLLSTCIKILNIELDGYRLIPMGSTSKIESYTKDASGKTVRTVVQLYCTGEFSIGGLFSHNNLDSGMVCLVEIVQQISQHIVSIDPACKLPYLLEGDKVGGFNIKPSSRSGLESWTHGCQCLLVDVKWVLAFSVAQYGDGGAAV